MILYQRYKIATVGVFDAIFDLKRQNY